VSVIPVARFEEYRPRLPDNERASTPTDLVIRTASLADANRVAELHAQRDGGNIADHAAGFARWVDTHRATGTGEIVVAEVAGQVVGVAKLHRFTPPDDAPTNAAPAGWYLSGLIVATDCRRRGIGRRLTRARVDWIAARDRVAYYFANAGNQASIDLHREFGFVEMTRDFAYPRVSFQGGVGILFKAELPRVTGRAPTGAADACQP
jgi:ribosomal protein S18 acetylase RimI-like enzyme